MGNSQQLQMTAMLTSSIVWVGDQILGCVFFFYWNLSISFTETPTMITFPCITKSLDLLDCHTGYSLLYFLNHSLVGEMLTSSLIGEKLLTFSLICEKLLTFHGNGVSLSVLKMSFSPSSENMTKCLVCCFTM